VLSVQVLQEFFVTITQEVARPYPTLPLVGSRWATYGLGWFQQDYRGLFVAMHTGSMDGRRSPASCPSASTSGCRLAIRQELDALTAGSDRVFRDEKEALRRLLFLQREQPARIPE